MEFGTHCRLENCNRLDFLPVKCPACKEPFCDTHYLPPAHECTAPGASEFKPEEFVDPASRKAASSTVRTPCPVQGCKRFTLQVEEREGGEGKAVGSRQTGPASSSSSRDVQQKEQKAFTHTAPRCYRCQGLFCPDHRPLPAHGCTAPPPKSEGQHKGEAADERKRRAQEMMAKHFPSKAKKKA
ncbi:unnamed protein product [Tilletia controversa]|uniref:AN1-type domain-containing protein n=3 Tax=Tilletia TaxID=13289 RepID=A0A8X7SYB3_9BASI|nr:hypothetical protein CF336_g4138 [Tilletia laevis]KAE8197361.1 hypothetical protein CF328_g3869 [Tilletia controversa]KAE8261139.1 hypothetical protein A4X03_0g3508 [Tilletia caries]KAE8202025.1 hypothetical protein CF335_g3571 [Tilletia laevis]KAE8250133.1 hypothetical protein A4X06_0g2911 [Tilletia controversa]